MPPLPVQIRRPNGQLVYAGQTVDVPSMALPPLAGVRDPLPIMPPAPVPNFSQPPSQFTVPTSHVVPPSAGVSGAPMPAPSALDAGDAANVGAGSVAGGSTADVSPADVAGAAIGGIGPSGISIGQGQSPGLNVGLTGNIGVNTGVGQLVGGGLPGMVANTAVNAGLNQAGVPTSFSLPGLLATIAPTAAHALGVAGMGVGGFQTAVGVAGAIADALGIPTANALAQQGHPAGLAATGQLTDLGISPEGVYSDPEGLTGPQGGYAAVLGPDSPLGPQGSYTSLDPSNPGMPGLSMGGVPGSPGLAGMGIGGGSVIGGPTSPTPGPGPTAPIADDPSGGELANPDGPIAGPGVPGGLDPTGSESAPDGGSTPGDTGGVGPDGGEWHTGGLVTHPAPGVQDVPGQTLQEGELVIPAPIVAAIGQLIARLVGAPGGGFQVG